MIINIVIFEQVEELDFVGPWEVFTMVNQLAALKKMTRPHQVALISEKGGSVSCAKGMRVEADFGFDEAPAPDVILVPGGQGARREASNPVMLEFVRAQAGACTWITSVCTGALVLAAAGLTAGRRVTTHWMSIENLRDRGGAAEVVSGQRWVVDGNLVTSAGVSAGIDMAIWLVSQVDGDEMAKSVVKGMEYDPQPPFAFSG